MTPQELNIFLKEYTETELENLERGRAIFFLGDHGVYRDDVFLKPGENIGVVRNSRFAPVAEHSHNYIEMNYVWSGSCVQTVEGVRVETRKGDFCMMDTAAVHAIGECGAEDIVVNLLMRKEFFDTGFFTRMTKSGILSGFLINAVTEQKNREHFLKISTQENPYIHEIMTRILCEYYGEDVGRQEMIDSYMVILFTELLRCYRSVSAAENGRYRGGETLLDILAYMEKNSAQCTLQETAEHFGFHPVYLTTLLKEKTGRGFTEHIQQQRLLKARMLLQRTELPVGEIVAETGYSNVNFFYKKFKEASGCTPLEYRRRQKNLKNGQ